MGGEDTPTAGVIDWDLILSERKERAPASWKVSWVDSRHRAKHSLKLWKQSML